LRKGGVGDGTRQMWQKFVYAVRGGGERKEGKEERNTGRGKQ